MLQLREVTRFPEQLLQLVSTSTSTVAMVHFCSPNTPHPLQEYVTLPEAFYLELDLEQQVLVERLSSNPISLITSGLHQLELQGLIQVRRVCFVSCDICHWVSVSRLA